MNLYEMTNNAKELYELLQQDIIDEQTFADTLESIGVEDKLIGYCQVIGQLKADVEMLKAEEDRIGAKRKSAEKSIDRMKNTIGEFMLACGKDKKKAGTFSISITPVKSVNIIDENKIPKEFLVEQKPKVDRVGIRKAIDSGVSVAGAELVTNNSVRIR